MKGTFGDKEKKKEKKKKAQELAANAAKKPAVRRGAVPPPLYRSVCLCLTVFCLQAAAVPGLTLALQVGFFITERMRRLLQDPCCEDPCSEPLLFPGSG